MTSVPSFHWNTTNEIVTAQSSCHKLSQISCQPFNSSEIKCFGASLPYDSTSFELVSDANSFEQAEEKLLLWSGLRAVPRCWDVIQPLLCSVYYPPCQNNRIKLPDRTLCVLTRNPCKIVETEYGWPKFLQCSNSDVFQDGCQKNKLTFNKSTCEPPLIATNNTASFYDEVEGCGLQCMNPLYNDKEHNEIHTFIAIWASLTCICTLYALLSFIIDWKNSSKYPARIIFYINLCFFIAGVGWLAQFFPGARNEIVCRKDGTMRLAEPVGTDESPSCVLVFLLVYFSVMAGVIWFDVLSYSWFLMFRALGTYQDPLIGKEKLFHFLAWGIPAVLSLIAIALSQIDGDSMSGICFIGYKNYVYRLGFLLVPIGIVLCVGGFFIFRGLAALFNIKKNTPALLSKSALAKINWAMIRIGVFAILAFGFVLITFAAHLYDYTNQALWEKSFREYIKCEANVTILEQLSGNPVQQCELQNHPSLSILKLNLVALFGTGIVMSTWVWTRASAANWRRAWFKLIGKSDNEMKRIKKKSRIIAKAFANRNIFRRKDNNRNINSASDDEDDSAMEELEYSEHTLSHQDPVGMDFCMHSMSQDVSSTWIHNVPKMVERRGGLLPDGKSSVRTSLDFRTLKPNFVPLKGQINLEPDLWAVSQYIDGSEMKTRVNTSRSTRKTAPAKNLNDVFIGTSPYNYPLRPLNPRRLPPVNFCGTHRCIDPLYASPFCSYHPASSGIDVHRSTDSRVMFDPTQCETQLQGWLHPGCVATGDHENVRSSKNHSRPSTRSSITSRRSSVCNSYDERFYFYRPSLHYSHCGGNARCHILPIVSHSSTISPQTRKKSKLKRSYDA